MKWGLPPFIQELMGYGDRDIAGHGPVKIREPVK
jgi:hypothetical protein